MRKEVRNASDTMIRQITPAKEFGSSGRMQIMTGGGDNRNGLIFFNLPFPKGVRILSATLRLWNQEAISGAFVLTAQRTGVKWSANKANWNNRPTLAGAAVSRSISGASAGTNWDLDVTTMLQAVSNGAAWYGFLIDTTTSSKLGIFKTAQNVTGTQRPLLIVTWSENPNKPSQLSPAGARKVATQKPLVTYDFSDPNGEGDLAQSFVQIYPTNAVGTPDFNSGWLLTDQPEVDLAATAYAGLPLDGSSKWWRVQAQDEDGNLSPWSDLAEMKYAVKGVVAITGPSGSTVSEGSPPVSWTFTGATQKSWQIFLALTSDPSKVIWDSGKVTSAALASTLAFGGITWTNRSYRITVRVWDDQAREGIPGYPAYSEAFKDVTYAAGATADVTSLGVSADAAKPNLIFTWVRSTAPDHFQVLRSKDGGTTYRFHAELNPADVLVSGTNYSWTDIGVDWYNSYTYKIISVVSSVGGAGATVAAKATKLAPFLSRSDGSNLCCFINPERDIQRLDIQELHQRMSGPPVLVTQVLGGYAGTVKGVFIDNMPSGFTAQQLRDNFNSIREDPGCPCKLSYADMSLNIVAYNMVIDSYADASGIYYTASFSWVQTS